MKYKVGDDIDMKYKCNIKNCPELGDRRCVFSQEELDYKNNYCLDLCPCGNIVYYKDLMEIKEINNE